jgi:MFS transporter, MHS family, citrate/tricarballylate:H+ symporter
MSLSAGERLGPRAPGAQEERTVTGSKFWPVLRVASGNFLEAYDFQVFGYYAVYISRAFFPSGNEFASLMLTLTTFGAGFLMRPLGAIILGAYVDRHGRRVGLLLTLGLMAVGTLSIACTPSFAAIGMLAPILVVAGRLLQGLSAGVEIGGASVYLAEIAKPGRRGFTTAWQSASQQVAVILAALFGLVLTMNLSQSQMVRWGWRVPLWTGCAIVPLLLLLRRSLTETDVFLARKQRLPVREIIKTLFANWYLVLLGTMLSTLTTVSFYMITAYTPTYGRSVLHLASTGSLMVTLCVGISNFIWVPVGGAISDRTGRRPLLLAIASLALITAYPALSWMVSVPSVARLLAVELWFSFLFGSYSGGMVVYLTEVMPADVRTSGWSLSFSLATALFGGFTPAISTYLIRWSGNAAIPGVWLSFTALLGLTSLLLLRRYSAAGADHQ